MSILMPPSYQFKGDKNKAISLKSQALQLYNFISRQAELGGIAKLSRSVTLPDGSIISISTYKNNLYDIRRGNIQIIALAKGGAGRLIKSSVIIHGVISNKFGVFDDSDGFVVYDGGEPTKYLSPVTLTSFLVAAKTALNQDSLYPNTFNRIKKVDDKGNYAGFYGFSDISNMVSRNLTLPMCDYGLLQYNKYKMYISGEILDVYKESKKDVFHVLSFSRSGGIRFIDYSTVTLNGTVTNILQLIITAPASIDTYPKYGLKVEMYNYITSAYSIAFSKTHSDIGTPTGYSEVSYTNSPYLTCLDAKFSPDKTKISFLIGLLGVVWLSNTGYITSVSEGSATAFDNILDLVVYRTTNTIGTMTEVSDPYLSCSELTPIVGKFYPNQSLTSRIKYDSTTTSYSELYTAKTSGFTYANEVGKSVRTLIAVTATSYLVFYYGHISSTTEAMTNALLEPLYNSAEGEGWATLQWDGPERVTWETETFSDPSISSFYMAKGVMERDYKYTIDYAGAGRPDLGVVSGTGTASCEVFREARYDEVYKGTGRLTYEASGTIPFGYYFDYDSGSPTYNSRGFVELGFKTETTGDFNRGNIVVDYSIDNTYHKISYWFGFPAELFAALQTLSSQTSWTKTVTTGGKLCLSLYKGDTPIQRYKMFATEQQDLVYSITYNSTENLVSTNFYLLGGSDRSYSETVTCKGISTLTENDVITATQATTINQIPSITSGCTDYDYNTGQYIESVYRNRYYSGIQHNVTDFTPYPNYTKVEYPTWRYIFLVKQMAMFNGGDHKINSEIANDPSSDIAIPYSSSATLNQHSSVNPSLVSDSSSIVFNFWRLNQVVPYEYAFLGGGLPATKQYTLNKTSASWYTYIPMKYNSNFSYGNTIPYQYVDSLGATQTNYVSIYNIGYAGYGTNTPFNTTLNKAGIAVLDSAGTVLKDNTLFPNGVDPNVVDNTRVSWRTVGGYTIREG